MENDINDLMNRLDNEKKKFDEWMDKQMEILRKKKEQQIQEKAEYEKQMNQMNQEKNNLNEEIEKAEISKSECISKEKEINELHKNLEKEISLISQNFDLYKNQIYLYETKVNRLKNFNAQKFEQIKKIDPILEAYETLFGISIEIGKGTTTFNFSSPKSKVVISEISNKYQFLEIPNQLVLYQRNIIDQFNSDKNLFNFISAIRSHLS